MGLNKANELLAKTWNRVRELEATRVELLKELKSHSLFERILHYSKFQDLRLRIRAAEAERGATAFLALGMARELRKLKRKAGIK